MATEYNANLVTDGLVCLIDPANPKSYSVNVHPNSRNIHSWVNSATGNSCTLSSDPTIGSSPAGGTPMKMITTGADAYTGTYNGSAWNIAPAAQNDVWTVSVYVRANVSTTAQLFMMCSNSIGTYLSSTNTTTSIGTGWTRISTTYTLPDATTAYVQVRLDGPDTYTAGTILWWDGLQVERSSSMSAYNPTQNLNGVTVNDISGNGYNFTMVNRPTYSSVNGGVLVTNGTNNYLYNSALNLSSGASTVFGAARYVTVANGRMINGYNNNWLMGHWSSSTQNFYAVGWVSGSGAGAGDTNWRTYAAICDTLNSSSYTLYVNGAPNVGPTSGGTAGPNGINIGVSGTGGSEFANGHFGFLAVYNRQLTAAEVAQNHNAVKGRYSL